MRLFCALQVKQQGILCQKNTKGKSKRSVTDCLCKALKQGRKAWEKRHLLEKQETDRSAVHQDEYQASCMHEQHTDKI